MAEHERDTIDESIGASIWRDLRVVLRRMCLVFIPGVTSLSSELRDWELWGNLFICMSLAVILSLESYDQASTVFSIVFIVVWLGSFLITINARLLGAKLSFFQTVCLLGYCIVPLLLASILCLIFNKFLSSALAVVLRFSMVMVAVIWSIVAAGTFMTDAEIPDGKLGLALYPVMLFYLSLGWMILMAFQQYKHPPSQGSGGGSPTPTPAPVMPTGGDSNSTRFQVEMAQY
mmetsp:Transcript_6089/g.10955  ORF Transcript_6089/g.10955 Transcript_6089/m.10955 type:complete len:232 (-) Transcript_6089:57-752(-)